MKNKFYNTLMLLSSVLVISSCTTPVKSTKILTSIALTPDHSLTGQVFREVNTYRAQKGVSPLVRHAGLDRLAQQHCQYLSDHRGDFSIYGKNVSHFGFESRSYAAQTVYQMANCSENVASTTWRGKGTANHLVKMWISSKSHESSMCDTWTHTGVGTVVDKDGTVFSTQLFGVESQAGQVRSNLFASHL